MSSETESLRVLSERATGGVWGDPRLPARFWAKVETASDCWEWQGYRSTAGYGRYFHDGSMRLAHRVSYVALCADIGASTLDHLCRNKACVNPAHLEPVSIAENNRRGTSRSAQNLRKTRCPAGHLYDDENTRVTQAGRYCRACRREAKRRRTECPDCGASLAVNSLGRHRRTHQGDAA